MRKSGGRRQRESSGAFRRNARLPSPDSRLIEDRSPTPGRLGRPDAGFAGNGIINFCGVKSRPGAESGVVSWALGHERRHRHRRGAREISDDEALGGRGGGQPRPRRARPRIWGGRRGVLEARLQVRPAEVGRGQRGGQGRDTGLLRPRPREGLVLRLRSAEGELSGPFCAPASTVFSPTSARPRGG